MQNSSPSKRLDYIDIAKGIGMLFVMFAHVNYTPKQLVLTYSFHMPLFFIISGMLFDRERFASFGEFIKRRLKTLILPYFVFSFLAIAYAFLSERMFPEVFDITRDQYIKFFKQVFIASGSAGTCNVPLWFVPNLFVIEIMYYFISKLNVKVIIPLVTALAGLGWLLQSKLLPFDNKLLPWTFDSALFALSFYALGNLCFPLVKQAAAYINENRHKWIICLEIILLSFIPWLSLTLINGKVSLGSRDLENGVLFFMTGVLGTVIILTVSLLFGQNRFLRFCGRNSFILMAVHVVFRRYTVPKLYHAFGFELYDRKIFIETIVPIIIVMSLSLIFTWVYELVRKKILQKTAK